MKTRILFSGAVAVLLAAILVACVGGSFFPGGAVPVVYPTVPKFVIGVDAPPSGPGPRVAGATAPPRLLTSTCFLWMRLPACSARR